MVLDQSAAKTRMMHSERQGGNQHVTNLCRSNLVLMLHDCCMPFGLYHFSSDSDRDPPKVLLSGMFWFASGVLDPNSIAFNEHRVFQRLTCRLHM